MDSKVRASIAVLGAALMLPGMASAFTIYDEFGSFEDASWGGNGIPNDAVAASMQIVNGADTVRVAMSATERYSNPAVGDNGAAIYEAGAGSNCGVDTDPLNCPGSATQGALWNWNFFVDVEGGGTLGDYQIDLYYDLDSAGPNAFGDLSGLGKFDITGYLYATGNEGLTKIEDSQNNLFGVWGADSAFIDAPDVAFDPNALGNYQYAITVSRTGFPVDTVAMEVNVVPIPAAVWLFGSAIGMLGWMRRRRTV